MTRKRTVALIGSNGRQGTLTDGVVHGLVDGRPDPSSLLACDDHLSNLEGREVREAKLDEFALLVQLVDCF